MENFMQDITSKIDSNNAALERDYQVKKRAQQNLAINLSRISPASALTFSTMSLARTGLDENQRFLDSIRAYKPILSKWASTMMARNLDFQNGGVNVKVDLSDMPLHSFESESLSKSLARAIPDIVLMIVLIIVFFAGAYVSFLKYDVR
jgi:ABC-type transport system involved in multi-copper enzyme maturation permease subunit